jgi:hypothetical protein
VPAAASDCKQTRPGVARACAAAAFAIAITASAGEQAPDAAPDFLAALAGDWRGRAVQTPAGPLPYDIRFAPDPAGCMAGIAAPGGASHHWKFCAGRAGLELEFLSDFRGNDRPLFLRLQGREGDSLVFRSPTLEFLKIHALLQSGCLRLTVLHDDRLHVDIHLRRPPPTGESAENHPCPWGAPVSPAA